MKLAILLLAIIATCASEEGRTFNGLSGLAHGISHWLLNSVGDYDTKHHGYHGIPYYGGHYGAQFGGHYGAHFGGHYGGQYHRPGYLSYGGYRDDNYDYY